MTTRNDSSPTRVTVRSASMPPPSLSSWVYTARPTSPATSFAHSRDSAAAAPGPRTSILANDDWSNSAAASRAARHSAPMAGDQNSPAQPRGRSDSSPAPALEPNQFTRSQPAFSPNSASSAASRG